METQVYYFSATGNSLAVARQIAQIIGGVTVSIPRALKTGQVRLESQRIGIVFPAYLTAVMGVPLIVERFLRSVDRLEGVRVFAVCTCGGYPFANAFLPLEKLLRLVRERGGTPDGVFSVRMPMNNLDYDHIPVPISRDIPKIIERAKQKTDRIGTRILSGKGTQFVLLKWLICRLIGGVYRAVRKPTLGLLAKRAKLDETANLSVDALVPLTDRSITVNENCTGCGTCAKVCPVKNIVLQSGSPVFQHRCEMCFACDEWCPVGAIQHWSRAEGVKYRYPNVEIKDLR